MITFDALAAGQEFGVCPFDFTDEAVEQWATLFPDDSACWPVMPPAMTSMVVMRAFMQLLRDRPPGNIHAGQKFVIATLPRLGDSLITTLGCIGKEVKNERRWVRFGSETRDHSGRPLFRGEMTTIWAA